MSKERERRPISKKLRFEVFKRDSFRCQYCGRSAPDVVLEIDHIKPVKEGGTNTLDNLITACRECNAGKGARLLDDKSILEKQRRQLEELNERREQLKMMMQWREELMGLEEEKLNKAREYFENLALCTVTKRGLEQLKKLLRKYPLEVVLDAIEDATTQYLVSDGDRYTHESVEKAFEYIGKICSVKQATQKKPYLRDLFYIRGILKNRLRHCDKHKALSLLEKAYLAGASIESLKDLALSARNWSEWRAAMEDFIDSAQDD